MGRLAVTALATALMVLFGTGTAHATSVHVVGPNDPEWGWPESLSSEFDGSAVVNATNVKLNGKLRAGSSQPNACLYLNVLTTYTSYDQQVLCRSYGAWKTFATTHSFRGRALKVGLTVCAYAVISPDSDPNGPKDWTCGSTTWVLTWK